MNPQEKLVRRVSQGFRKTGSWPRYSDLEREFMRHGSLEHVFAELSPDVLRTVGGGETEEIQFASLQAYAASSKNLDDVNRVARAARFLALRRIEGAQSVKASDIGTALRINELLLWRVVKLLDQDSTYLTSGGMRGETLDQWEFRISDRAIYFKGVRSFADLVRAKEHVEAVEQLRGKRNVPFGWSGSIAQSTKPTPIFLRTWDKLEYTLHPAIDEASRSLLQSGHLNEAVRNACARLESLLQGSVSDYRSPANTLIGKAFSDKQPAIRLNGLATSSDENEQNGFKFLTMGVNAAFRNVLSHGSCEELTMAEAIERLVTLSLIFGRLEKAVTNRAGE